MTEVIAGQPLPGEPAPAGSRPRLFYGWVIVAVLAVCGALSMSMGALNFGLFIKPMGDELGIGRSIFGWAQSARQLTSALTAPFLGTLLDRFGARLLVPFAALMTGLAMVGLSAATEWWQIIALFSMMGVVGMVGPGAFILTVPVTKWFVRKRGRAMSFTSLGTPTGGVIFIPLTQVFIDGVGWRSTWITLAAIGVGLIVPLSLLFLRRQPEDIGLLPDGDHARPPVDAHPRDSAPRTTPPHSPDEHSWTRAEAIRTFAFWKLVLVFGMVMMAIATMAVHRIPSFMDRGLDPQLISYATALDAGASGVSTFIAGTLAQRFHARYVGACGFLLLALSAYLSISADTHASMFAAMIVFGFGIGSGMLIQNYLWADYFGRRYQGSIRGAVTPVILIFSAIGSPVAGYVRDAVGTYDPVWTGAIVLMLLGAVALVTTPPPRHPRAH